MADTPQNEVMENPKIIEMEDPNNTAINSGEIAVNEIDKEKIEMSRRIVELEKLVGELLKKGENKEGKKNEDEQNSKEKINNSNRPITVPDWLPLMGGNLLPAIKEFEWDPNDKGEAERFITSLKNLAAENHWSPFKTQMVLESKLGHKARAKYYEGLGCDTELKIEHRLGEFIKLFTIKPNKTEAQDLFLKCQQRNGESVISFKLRLIGLSEPFKEKFKEHRDIYDEFLTCQFKKGLSPNLKMEVLKAGENNFYKTVRKAMEIEECIQLCNDRVDQVNTVTEQGDIEGIKQALKEINERINKQEETNKKTYAQAITQGLTCKICHKLGHREETCWFINENATRVCFHCKQMGHIRANCWKIQGGKFFYNTAQIKDDTKALKIADSLPEVRENETGVGISKPKGSPHYCSLCDCYGHTSYHCKQKKGTNIINKIYKESSELNKLIDIQNKKQNEKLSRINEHTQHKKKTLSAENNIKTFAAYNMYDLLNDDEDDTTNNTDEITIDNFYENISKTKKTSKPQVIICCEKHEGNKPIIELEVFGRPIKALCDTGAEISVINDQFIKDYDPTRGYCGTTLSSFSGSSVNGYHTEIIMSIGNIKFKQIACIAPIDGEGKFEMLLGFDFLQRHMAINDVVNGKIRFAIDKDNSKPYSNLKNKSGFSNQCNFIKKDIQEKEFEDLVTLLGVDQMDMSEKHKIKFKSIIRDHQNILIEDVTKMTGANIEPYAPVFKSDTPIYQRQFRMPHSMANPLRKKLDKFEAAGIITRKASSLWNSPVLAIRKPDGVDVRMVLDLRKINEIIEPLPYPLMRIEDIISRLGGSKIFSKLDLNNGFFNIKLAESVKDRFSFTTPWGRYRMERLPQGCITSASIFQRVMNESLHDLIGQGKVFVFQDDIIVHSTTMEEHLNTLNELFIVLAKINMATRPSKCVFFRDSVKFLGHIVGKQGSEPSDENIAAIKHFPRPRTVRQVRSFLGTVNFYRKFINNITEIAAPLYSLIKKDHVKINWTEECEKSFVSLKQALMNAPLLAYPDFKKNFIIKCDASNVGIGGVLEQETDGDSQPVAYCSRKLNKAECNYSVIEREALAIVFTLTQFRYLIHGYPVLLKTDHKPLTYIFKLKDTNQRLVRWLLLIQDYNLKIEHIAGKYNFTADMLSRGDDEIEHVSARVVGEVHAVLSNERIKTEQNKDPACINIFDKIIKGEYKNFEYILDESMVVCKLISPKRGRGWGYRVVVPISLRKDVIYNYHDSIHSGHLSLPKVIWKIKQVFTWDTIFKDIDEYIRTCEKCQKRNVHHTRAPFQPITPPSYPMQRLNIDILGPFNSNKLGLKYLIVYTDSLTRFVIANPLPNMEASTVADDYIKNVFCVHGGSQEILTDKGAQFTSAIFEQLCKRLNIKHITTSGYRPCSNGIAERSNQKIINILAQSCNKFYTDWHLKIPFVTHAINTSPNRSSGDSPFYLLHAFDPIDPIIEASSTHKLKYGTIPEFVEHTAIEIEEARAIVEEHLTLSSVVNCESKSKGRKLREFYVGQQVLYLDSTSYSGSNRKLKPRYKGPYRIIERLGIVNYKIRNITNPKDLKTTHVDKLKAFYPRYILSDKNNDRARTIPTDTYKKTQQHDYPSYMLDIDRYNVQNKNFDLATQETINTDPKDMSETNPLLTELSAPAKDGGVVIVPPIILGEKNSGQDPHTSETNATEGMDVSVDSSTHISSSTDTRLCPSNPVIPMILDLKSQTVGSNVGNTEQNLVGGSNVPVTPAPVSLSAPSELRSTSTRYNLRDYLKLPDKLTL